MSKERAIPEGFHSVTPYLIVKDGAKALEFYVKAFGAQVTEKHLTDDGKIMHALFKIGDSLVMLSDEFPEPESCGLVAPSAKGQSVSLHVYVENVDASFDQAVKAGANVVMPVEDQFWGDRFGQLSDPFGHRWSLSTPLAYLKPKKPGSSCCGCSH